MRKTFLLTTCLFYASYAALAQFPNTPQTPQASGFQPVPLGTPQPQYSASSVPSPNRQMQMGATAQDIANSSRPITPTVNQKREEVQQLIRQVQEEEKYIAAHGQGIKKEAALNPRMADYLAALAHLQDMLSGKSPLSVVDAYYTIENAYGNPYLTREEYNETIRQSVAFIKAWMVQNGLDLKDNYQIQFAIKKFMSENLTVSKSTKKGDKGPKLESYTHKPFQYDYNDYSGTTDYRNLFLTKCLATGFGQCASMPAVYLVLAENLGVKAYLSMAPQHSFVKFPDNSGYILNYEPTSNWELSDKWYKDNMFISAQAVKTGAYLDTLNSKQVVANCIYDLAVQYIVTDHSMKEDFILSCLKAGAPYFPKNNNLQALFIRSMHLKTLLREAMRRNNIASIDDIGKSPETKKIYYDYMANEGHITRLGYQDMPTGMYEELLNQHEFKGKVQAQRNITGKDKRNLFNKIGQ